MLYRLMYSFHLPRVQQCTQYECFCTVTFYFASKSTEFCLTIRIIIKYKKRGKNPH